MALSHDTIVVMHILKQLLTEVTLFKEELTDLRSIVEQFVVPHLESEGYESDDSESSATSVHSAP